MTALHLACGCWTGSSSCGIDTSRPVTRLVGDCRLHGLQHVDLRPDLLEPILTGILERSRARPQGITADPDTVRYAFRDGSTLILEP